MTPDEKRLLEKVALLSEENNSMLRSIRSLNRWSMAYRIFYWVVIIFLSFGAYYYIQPYIDQIRGVSGGVKGAVDSVQNISGMLKNL